MATASNRTRIPAGGALGYALVKLSTADFDYDWQPVASGGGTWGTITGTLSNQLDLQNALDNKVDLFLGDPNAILFTGAGNDVQTEANLTWNGFAFNVPGTITGTNLSGTNTGDQTLNSLLPNQTGNSGKALITDGANASWQAVSSLDLVSYSYAGGF